MLRFFAVWDNFSNEEVPEEEWDVRPANEMEYRGLDALLGGSEWREKEFPETDEGVLEADKFLYSLIPTGKSPEWFFLMPYLKRVGFSDEQGIEMVNQMEVGGLCGCSFYKD